MSLLSPAGSVQYFERSAADDNEASSLEDDSLDRPFALAGRKRASEIELYALDCSKRAKLSIEGQYNAQDFAKVFRLFLCPLLPLLIFTPDSRSFL